MRWLGAIFVAAASFDLAASAEPLIVASTPEQGGFAVERSVVDKEIEECWAVDAHRVDAQMACTQRLLTRCTTEEPSVGMARQRDLFCLDATLIAWEAVLAEQWAHLWEMSEMQDAEDAAHASARTSRYRLEVLPEAQAAWRAYRDAECASVAAEFRLGTYASVFAMRCRLELTISRAVWIERRGAR